MNAPRILVIVGTPLPDSLVHALADSYVTGAREAGAEVRVVDLARDEIPGHPTERNELRAPRDTNDRPLDLTVAAYVDSLAWAEHVVFVYPQWWGTYPAALKAFVDRVFLANTAFRYRPARKLWDKLLTGRTARVVMTMDSPSFWNRFVYRNAAETSLSRAILGYCGIRTTGITRFAEVRHRSDETRAEWIAQMGKLGEKDARRIAPRERNHLSLDDERSLRSAA